MYFGIRQSRTQQLMLDALASAGLTDGSALVLFGGKAPLTLFTHTLSFFAENAALPHGGATDRALRKDDLILFDITGALHGYYSDNTRVCLALTRSV